MRRAHVSVLVAAAVLFSLSCSDQRRDVLPTSPRTPQILRPSRTEAPVPGTCTTQNVLEAEINAVIRPGKDRGKVHGDVGKLNAAINKHDYAAAQALAFSITDFVIKKFKANETTGTPAQVTSLINHVFCYAGLAISITDPANANVVPPSATDTQTVKSKNNDAGTQLPPGSITETTVLEFIPIADILPGDGRGPLGTKLDQYAGFFAISVGSASGAGPADSVIVGICPAPGIVWTTAVRNRLRLGHKKAIGGFEIAPTADASFLQCPTSTAQLSKLPRWLRSLASLVMPKVLYARQEEFFSGGVGGTAGEFSDFGPVDPELSFSGGVGGTAGEFKKSPVPRKLEPQAPAKSPRVAPNFLLRPGSQGSRLNNASGDVCVAPLAYPWGTDVEALCRPQITVTTNLGTVLTGVPVAWTDTTGGGTIAAEASGSQTCGTFGSTAATTTDASGTARVCWTMGPTPGTNNNKVRARPSAGGDAPAGVMFVPAVVTFTASALKRTPVATAVGETVTYDGLDHPGSGTCSEGLTPVLSYSGGSVPHNIGVYTLTVTCGDGNVRYNTVESTATITITGFFESFEAGIPAGWTLSGTGGTSAAVPNLSPTQGTKFAFIATPGVVNTTFGGTGGTTLKSSTFSAAAGDVLSLDFNFLTTDGTTPFSDFTFVQLLNASDGFVATLGNANTTGPVDRAVPALGGPPPPAISLGVTLTPPTAFFDGVATGPLVLDGVTFGPLKYPNTVGTKGGSTGFIHSSFTIPATGTFKLLFVVMDYGNRNYPSALVIDHISVQRP